MDAGKRFCVIAENSKSPYPYQRRDGPDRFWFATRKEAEEHAMTIIQAMTSRYALDSHGDRRKPEFLVVEAVCLVRHVPPKPPIEVVELVNRVPFTNEV